MALTKKDRKEVAQMMSRALSVANAIPIENGGASILGSIVEDAAEDSTVKFIYAIDAITITTIHTGNTGVVLRGTTDGEVVSAQFGFPRNDESFLNEMKRAQSHHLKSIIAYHTDTMMISSYIVLLP